jgi:6-phosphogluconolactonase
MGLRLSRRPLLIAPLSMLSQVGAALRSQTVYVGTRTREGRSEGIHRLSFDPNNGALSAATLVSKTIDPSFLAIRGRFLYSVVAAPQGQVRAFAVEPDLSLRLLNEVTSQGAGPAHVQIDRTGKWASVANYTSGSVAVYRIESDGRLSDAVDFMQHSGSSIHPERQQGPHAHSSYFSHDNTRLYVPDLGLDEVKVYGFDTATGKLTPKPSLPTPKGAGPRHLALGKRRIYVLNELTSSVSVFEQTGRLLETVSALPDGFTGQSTAAEIIFDQAEKYLYASNRGADTIAIFRIGAKLKKIADVKVGRGPRNYVLSPDGKFMLVASQLDDTVQSYRVSPGALSPVGDPVKIGSPICLRFLV